MDIHYLWDMDSLPVTSGGAHVVINTPTRYDNRYITPAMAAGRYLCTPMRKIVEYIPVREKIRSWSVYALLTVINIHPASTMGHLGDLTGMDIRTISKCIDYLIELRYIRVITIHRLIVPFGKYKPQRAYVMTTAGRTALSKLMDY